MHPLAFVVTGLPAALIILVIVVIIVTGIVSLIRGSFTSAKRLARRAERRRHG